MHAFAAIRGKQQRAGWKFARLPSDHPEACFEGPFLGRVFEGDRVQHGEFPGELELRRMHALRDGAGQGPEGRRAAVVGNALADLEAPVPGRSGEQGLAAPTQSGEEFGAGP